MAYQPRILAFSGSARKESWNKKLVRIAVAGARSAGANVTLLELDQLPLPVFDEDTEARGTPENALRLKQLMRESDGFLIASPEYNSSVTAALKNAIDWASRPAPTEPALVAFAGKVAALMSGSPGALGGLRGLVHLRAIMSNIQVLVLPDQVAVGKIHESFRSDGGLTDGKQQHAIESLGIKLTELLKRIHE